MEHELTRNDQYDRTPLFISFLTEFIGTGILMWIGCLGCIEFFSMGPVLPAFTFGLAVTTAVQAFGHISPVHVNPAISLGVLVLGKMRPTQFPVYLVGQYLGALAGYGLLQVVMPNTPVEVCLLARGPFMTSLKAFAIESGIAFCLMLAVAGVEDIHNQENKDSLPLKIGLVVSGLVFCSYPFTGAGLNPARSLPPALIYNNWEDHWVYHVAPYTAMVLAALLYRFVYDGTEYYSLHAFVKRTFAWCTVKTF